MRINRSDNVESKGFTHARAFSFKDEYLIPMGKYNSMREVVDDATKSGTQILTFKSTRAVPIHSYME